jgi:CRP-like cAMP-binding protein/ActR/RegA family two-component response regulator
MKTVLLIEDDLTLLANTKELLELYNYKVWYAQNGEIGVNLALQTNPDIIICDMIMPVLDGNGVFEKLFANKATRDIPFIFLSCKSDMNSMKKRMSLEVCDHILKPFKIRDLIKLIEKKLVKPSNFDQNTTKKSYPFSEPLRINSLDQLREFFKKAGEIQAFSKHEVIYRERKNADSIYFVEEGLLKTHRMDEFGKELITGIYKTGEFLGFYSFKNLSSYPETASALENGSLYRLSIKQFQEILSGSHQLTLELAQLQSENLAVLRSHLLEMAYGSVLKKTTNTILKFVDGAQDNLLEAIKISRSDLASIAGISTESLIRSLSLLKKEKLIDIEGRNIKILNLEELYHIR